MMDLICVKLERPHTTSPQTIAKEGKPPYFREIQVGEILYFGYIDFNMGEIWNLNDVK